MAVFFWLYPVESTVGAFSESTALWLKPRATRASHR